MITRRKLVTYSPLIVLGTTGLSGLADASGTSAARADLTFYVAGVRFQKPISRRLQPGARVMARREPYETSFCYTVYADGERLGYVPQKLLPRLNDSPPILIGQVIQLASHALPWKKYLVSLKLEAA